MSAAEKYIPRYTVADYQTWEGDWELWAGVPVSMTPSPFGRHQAVLTRLPCHLCNSIAKHVEQFSELSFSRASEPAKAPCAAEVLISLDWIVTDNTVVRPDLIVVCDGPPERHLESPPALAAEIISDSSSLRDTIHKRDLYEEQGVGVYVLIDPVNETMLVYQRDKSGEWNAASVEDMIEIKICDDCAINIHKSAIFT